MKLILYQRVEHERRKMSRANEFTVVCVCLGSLNCQPLVVHRSSRLMGNFSTENSPKTWQKCDKNVSSNSILQRMKKFPMH